MLWFYLVFIFFFALFSVAGFWIMADGIPIKSFFGVFQVCIGIGLFTYFTTLISEMIADYLRDKYLEAQKQLDSFGKDSSQ